MFKAAILLATTLTTMSYDTEGNVLKLGVEDFNKALEQFPGIGVKFYAPWCGHCKKLAPVYVEAAQVLKQKGSSARLAQVDCTVHKQICTKYQVKGYPTVHFFGKNSSEPLKYAGQRTKQAIVDWVIQNTPSGQPTITTSAETVEQSKDQSEYTKEGNLYKLNQNTFQRAKEQFDFLFVKFFAPWCGHCKKMAETWKKLANQINNPRVAIAEVDCTTDKEVCTQNGVRGYPTVQLFIKGGESIKHSGARTLEGFTQWLGEKTGQIGSEVNNQANTEEL